jgi:hypothetical protein
MITIIKLQQVDMYNDMYSVHNGVLMWHRASPP